MGTWGRTDHHLNVDKRGCGKESVTCLQTTFCLKARKVILITRWAAGQVQILKNVLYVCVLPFLNCLRMK
jgi:hypothetical protein